MVVGRDSQDCAFKTCCVFFFKYLSPNRIFLPCARVLHSTGADVDLAAERIRFDYDAAKIFLLLFGYYPSINLLASAQDFALLIPADISQSMDRWKRIPFNFQPLAGLACSPIAFINDNLAVTKVGGYPSMEGWTEGADCLPSRRTHRSMSAVSWVYAGHEYLRVRCWPHVNNRLALSITSSLIQVRRTRGEAYVGWIASHTRRLSDGNGSVPRVQAVDKRSPGQCGPLPETYAHSTSYSRHSSHSRSPGPTAARCQSA